MEQIERTRQREILRNWNGLVNGVIGRLGGFDSDYGGEERMEDYRMLKRIRGKLGVGLGGDGDFLGEERGVLGEEIDGVLREIEDGLVGRRLGGMLGEKIGVAKARVGLLGRAGTIYFF